MNTHWLDAVRPIFMQARKDLYYPPVLRVEPARVELVEMAFSARRYKVLVGEAAVAKFSREALLGIFHHELDHWAKHPYDLKTLILEQHWLSGTPEKDATRNLYDDVVVNLDLVINRGLPQVAQAYRELPAASKIDRLLRAFFCEVTGIDFGSPELEMTLEKRIKSLRAIDFLDLSRVRIKSNIRRFAEIIADLLDEKVELPFVFFSPDNFRAEDVTRAMEGIAEEVSPQEYEKIASEILKEFKDSWQPPPEKGLGGQGIRPGERVLLQELETPGVGWYRSRARRYAVSIESLVKKGSLYPDQITDFELDDGIDTFNPVESYGKVLPSLAKKHRLAEFERYGELSVPDAVIVIDSSGSMPDPEKVISYAVLGAFSVARNYFKLGARVGVINFSNVNLELEPTRERQKVYRLLKTYQGYGTTLHIDDLERYVTGLAHGVKDYILITDAGIDNIQMVVDYFSKIEGRLTIIWIKTEIELEEKFKENYELFKENLAASVTFVEISREQDMPRIAVGKTFGESLWTR